MRSLLFCLLGLVFLFPREIVAQSEITLDSCIARALEANYSIKIIRNQQQQAENMLRK